MGDVTDKVVLLHTISLGYLMLLRNVRCAGASSNIVDATFTAPSDGEYYFTFLKLRLGITSKFFMSHLYKQVSTLLLSVAGVILFAML